MERPSWRAGALAIGVALGGCEVDRTDAAVAWDETTVGPEESSDSDGGAAFGPEDGDRLSGLGDPSPAGSGGNTGGDTPPPDDVPLPWDSDEIVGIGIAGLTGKTYAWTRANTVSAGIAAQLTRYRAPYRWSAPGAASVRDFAISKTDKTYVWFSDSKVGKGSTANPTTSSLVTYTLPGGRLPADIVGVAILKANDQVHAYYDDGTYSRGVWTSLGSVASGSAYSLPPGRTATDIVGMDFGPDGKLYTWFDDGYYSIGTASDLDFWQAPRRYARHGLLASHWPANVNTPPGPPSDWPPEVEDPPYVAPGVSPSPSTVFAAAGGGSSDVVLAAGADAIGLALDASVHFYDKDGTPLSGTGFLAGGQLDLESMFAEFVRNDPLPGGSEPAPNDVNQYLGFDCDDDSIPETNRHKFCVSRAPYDTRVAYDVEGDRWVIAGAMRNVVATVYYENQHAHPDATDAELLAMPYSDEYPMCGIYPTPASEVLDVESPQHCKMATRLVVLAVSRTSDPREGWFTYSFVESNYRDSPWIAIDGDWVIVSHKKAEQPLGPVASLVSLSDMRMGRLRPEYVHYYESDLGGHIIAEPPAQTGTWPDHSLVVDVSGTNWTMFALPHPSPAYGKLPAGSTSIILSDAPGFSREKGVFRHDALHLANEEFTPDGPNEQSKVHWVKVPLSLVGGVPVASTQLPGYKHFVVQAGDPSELRAEEPALAINGAEEGFLVYGVSGVDPDDEIAPSVRHQLWLDESPWLATFQTFQAGTGYAAGYTRNKIKAISAAVDPVDDRTFWAVHKYGTPDGWRNVIGRVDPN